jgi:ribosomal protein S18 acetylase RimI-like enzyme
MNIRQATLKDINAIEILWKEMATLHQEIDSYFMLIPEAEESHRSYMVSLIKDGSKRVFVAEKFGSLLGYLVADVKDYPPIYRYKRYGHISGISVSTADRRKGVGRKLLGAALEWFQTMGLKRVECGVAVNNHLSQGFWKEMGFRAYMEKHVLDL